MKSLAVTVCAVVCSLCLGLTAGRATAAESLRFNRDIRPILSEYCLHCHGPDKNHREADLRLDQVDDVLRQRDGHAVIVPRKPELSTLIERITSADPDERMPPAKTQRPLSAAQIETLRRWVTEGADYEPHWSFLPPVRANLPDVKKADWARQPFDRFVQSRLDREGLAFAPEAEPLTLLRRLTFDLTGLPPTPEEVAEFEQYAHRNPQSAIEQLVDRLLASPRYGERMALPWLDAARYADTNGYQSDGPRYMWRWRDWVIDALNRNQPFDRFTIEQLAGDLLPGATVEQMIATGFNRNHRGNAEGGIIPEEFRIEYVVDRVETTATVWLGLTMGCARCHDHKYDPLTQREFYQFFAFFNQVPEPGKAVRDDNSPPLVKAPTQEIREQLAEFDRRQERLGKKIELMNMIDAYDRQKWLEPPAPFGVGYHRTELVTGLVFHASLNNSLDLDLNSPQPSISNVLSVPANAASLKVHAPTDPKNAPMPYAAHFVDGDAKYGAGRIGEAAEFDGKRFIDLGPYANFREFHRFSLAAWVKLADRNGGTVLAKMGDDANHQGYGMHIDEGRVQVSLSNRMLDDAMIVESEQALEPNRWYHLLATYDGTKFANGIRLFVDGQPARTRVVMDLLSNAIGNDEPLRIGARGDEERFRGLIDDVRIYARDLTPEQAKILATPETLAELHATKRRTANQNAKLIAYYNHHLAPQEYRDLLAQRDTLREERREFEEQIPTVMVMQDGPVKRETHVLLRGEYNRPGARVEADAPGCLPSLPANAPRDRLAVARWLVSRDHPLTARVAVNRYWQMLFGQGLVKTTEDFGSQGELPSHPELLDWLAVDFMESGWDVKRLLRTIVTSATYRQSSHVSKQLVARDPENRLLARGARFRLSAEMVRDQALFASGLLSERVGGPSVKPYQPDGLWEELAANIVPYIQDHGPDLYRRSLYTFWKRTVAPPSMMTFDAAGREACVVRSSRTNTPLQALNLLNDVTYVEAARALAERVMSQTSSPAERISLLYRYVLSRPPSDDELQLLGKSYARYVERYRSNLVAATNLVRVGEATSHEKLEPAEHAALTTLASTLFNLDETITRE